MSFRLDRTKIKKVIRCFSGVSLAIGSSWIAGNAIASESYGNSSPFSLAQQPNCAAPQSQLEVNACAQINWVISDDELRRSYENLAPNLLLSRRRELSESQIAWEYFRNAECQFYGSLVEGTTSQAALEYGCLAALTQQRTTNLNTYLRGEFSGAVLNDNLSVENQLSKLYRQLLQQIVPVSRRNQLGNAQFAWIEFRDFMCNFERSGGGSVAFENCLIRSTEQRIRQLENHLANLG